MKINDINILDFPQKTYQTISSWEYKNDEFIEKSREICKEIDLKVFINNQKLLSIICYPTDLWPLVVGYLSTEGILTDLKNIQSVEWNQTELEVKIEGCFNHELIQKWRTNKHLLSGCGKALSSYLNLQGGLNSDSDINFTLSANSLLERMSEMLNYSTIHKKTHGVHTCALSDGNKLIYIAEDIGRHNALDKVVGKALIHKDTLHNKVLLCTGRFSSEMALKAISQKIPIIISRSAITLHTLELAKKANITVIGYAWGEDFEIFSHPKRIIH